MTVRIHVCGCRGSFPQSSIDHIGYGLNTTCFYIDCGVHLFVDAGTGIIKGSRLVNDNEPVHILLSHVHIDHVMGLFECPFLYERDREIHIYGENRDGLDIGQQLAAIFRPPYWPVEIDRLPSKVFFHEIDDLATFSIGPVQIEAMRSRHPDLSLLFRMSFDDKKFGYVLDHEIGRDTKKDTVSFFRGCDLVIFDGNDIPENKKEGWGHSTWEEGIRLMKDGKIAKLLVAHYGYDLNDEVLKEEEKKALEASDDCIFAREGMVMEL